MNRPLSWWILFFGFFWLAIERWDLNLLELLGLAALVGFGSAILDLAAADVWSAIKAAWREGWNDEKREED